METKNKETGKKQEATQEKKRVNRSWEAFGRWKGSVVVNDPMLLL